MRNDNYPEDIRQYDNDPRSPFYSGPDQNDRDDWEHQQAENLVAAWKLELTVMGRIDETDRDEADIKVDALAAQISFDDQLWLDAAAHVASTAGDFDRHNEDWRY